MHAVGSTTTCESIVFREGPRIARPSSLTSNRCAHTCINACSKQNARTNLCVNLLFKLRDVTEPKHGTPIQWPSDLDAKS